MTQKKAIAYIDANNLYHGIIDRRNLPAAGYEPFSPERPWGDLLWLNLESFIKSCYIPSIDLIKIKIFQAPSYKKESLRRQQLYHNALLSLDTIDESSFYHGEFKPSIVRCSKCGHEHTLHTEKKTDAAMSTEILSDFFLANCAVTIIVGGDSDQVPVIEKIKSLNFSHEIYAIFPPSRKSKEIYKILGENNCRKINYRMLLRNQLTDLVNVNGFDIEKPIEYKRSKIDNNP